MSPSDAVPAARLAWYDRLIATQPGLERKGKTLPYTSVNGHMTSFLTVTGSLAMRLPAGEREVFLERHATTLQAAHGAVMQEYVAVPDELFADTERLAPAFAASYAYVAALKPKPTARTKR